MRKNAQKERSCINQLLLEILQVGIIIQMSDHMLLVGIWSVLKVLAIPETGFLLERDS